SRLEGLNKLYGSRILVSEDTRQQVPSDMFTFREVDRVRVKGKHKPVVLFELMVTKHELLPRFEQALEQYRAQAFEAAQRAFDELAQQYDDGPSRLYSSRCSEYLQTPPPDGWDGIYTAKSK
ncbi:MAG: adenylate/guanylate cyclase domain-containing protein, partial [Geobacter sp.]